MFDIFKNANDFSRNKELFLEYKKEQLDFMEYQENKEDFLVYKAHKDSFNSYRQAIGDSNTPFFLMYASDIDAEGNVEFSYDFSQEFIKLLEHQGITGEDEITILETYLYKIFEQTFFLNYVEKDKKEFEKRENQGKL